MSEFLLDPGIIKPLFEILHFSKIFVNRLFQISIELDTKFCCVQSNLTKGTVSVNLFFQERKFRELFRAIGVEYLKIFHFAGFHESVV